MTNFYSAVQQMRLFRVVYSATVAPFLRGGVDLYTKLYVAFISNDSKSAAKEHHAPPPSPHQKYNLKNLTPQLSVTQRSLLVCFPVSYTSPRSRLPLLSRPRRDATLNITYPLLSPPSVNYYRKKWQLLGGCCRLLRAASPLCTGTASGAFQARLARPGSLLLLLLRFSLLLTWLLLLLIHLNLLLLLLSLFLLFLLLFLLLLLLLPHLPASASLCN